MGGLEGSFVGTEGVADIDIDGDAMAFELPVARDRNIVPVADIIVGFVEVWRSVSGVFGPVKFPVAVE
jgi:hypothetical protein